MQVPTFFLQKKTLITEIVVLVLFLGGIYYLYTAFSEPTSTTTQNSINQQLLGTNFIVFLKAVNQDKLSFKESSLMNSQLVKQLQDFSVTIGPTDSRGRLDPFIPYASTRSIR
ncbi:MAG: hypothetical protein WCT07_00805 [Candidatus Paceibacterota bacterium]|jgi:hypothetical protein